MIRFREREFIGKVVSKEQSMYITIVTMCLYVVLTNCAVSLLNTLFVAAILCLLIISPIEIGFSIIVFGEAFLGYSAIPFPLPFGSSINVVTVWNVAMLIYAFRIIIKDNFSILKKKWLLVLLVIVFFALEFFGNSIKGAVNRSTMIIACYSFIAYFHSDREKRVMIAKSIIVMTLFIFVYGMLHLNLSYTAEGFRFAGVKDANNFALMCNISLFYILFEKRIFKHDLTYLCITPILILGCLITVSISGICTMAVLIFAFACLYNKKYRAIAVLVLIVFALVLGVIFPLLLTSEIGTLSYLAQRIYQIVENLKEGDYGSATTNRSDIWVQYMDLFKSFNFGDKLFGNASAVKDWMNSIKGNLASHNSYIDILLTYGFFGLFVLIALIINAIVSNAKEKDYKSLLLTLLLAINLFFRSIDSFLFFGLMLGCKAFNYTRRKDNAV